MDCWRHVARLAVQCASILPVGQAFGLRLVVMSWQLERKLLTASGVLQAFQDLQQFSRLSTFQGMFLDIVIYCIYIFYSLLLCLCIYAQADSPTPSLSRASATQPSTLTGWVGVENCPRLQISSFVNCRCDACPAGQKQSTGGSTFCEDCLAPSGFSGDQTWWNVLAQLNDVAHCFSTF